MSVIQKKNFYKLCRGYQSEATDFLFASDAALLLLQMGAGKTVITLTAILELLQDGHINDVLVVAPLAVCQNTWATEHLRWEHTAGLDISICCGSPGVRAASMDNRHTITVINYENLQWLRKHAPARRWDLVVMDEITRFNAGGKRYKALKPVLAGALMRWGLTGSLGANSVEHLFYPVQAVDGGAALGKTIAPFRHEFFTKVDYGWAARPGAPGLAAARIAHLCYQPDPVVYQSQLPDLVVQRHSLDIGPSAAAAYLSLKDEFVLGADITVASAGVLVGKLQQVGSNFAYKPDGSVLSLGSQRLDLVRELVDESGGGVIIWYWFAETRERLLAEGYLDLLPNLDEWNAGRVPVAICHPRSGGHGINAQAGGSRMIWMEHTWSAEERAQAIARLYRQGQAQTVFVHDIVGGIDTDILSAQEDKRSVAQIIAEKLR